MLFMVNINIAHCKRQCCSSSMSLLFMVNVNAVHGK